MLLNFYFSKGLVAGCHSFCLFFVFITYTLLSVSCELVLTLALAPSGV
jgi:hypothetical protein